MEQMKERTVDIRINFHKDHIEVFVNDKRAGVCHEYMPGCPLPWRARIRQSPKETHALDVGHLPTMERAIGCVISHSLANCTWDWVVKHRALETDPEEVEIIDLDAHDLFKDPESKNEWHKAFQSWAKNLTPEEKEAMLGEEDD